MRGCFSTISCERYCYPTGYEVTMASEHDVDITPRGTVAIDEWGGGPPRTRGVGRGTAASWVHSAAGRGKTATDLRRGREPAHAFGACPTSGRPSPSYGTQYYQGEP